VGATSNQRLKIKKGDNVLVLSGKEKGKKGKVIATFPRDNLVKIEGVNIIKKHAKPTQKVKQGGIREMEAAIDVSKVKIICPACNEPTKITRKVEEGYRIRECKKCGEIVDK